MRTYHPKSWSEQARELCDRVYDQVIYAYKNNENIPIEINYEMVEVTPKKWGSLTLQKSYRHPLIKRRALKRYGRKIREYKKNHNI